MKFNCVLAFALTLWLVVAPDASAAVRVPHVIGDNMVLQRDVPVPIWGWAAPGEQVTVTFGKQTKTAAADKDGKWKVVLDKLEASSTPSELAVAGAGGAAGADRIVIRNVLVGEVWFASGQSNMYLEVKSLKGQTAPTLQEAGKYPNIRLMVIGQHKSATPCEDRPVSWQPCNAGSVQKFSAVAYFFAKNIHAELKVPVGIMTAAIPGEFIEEFAPSLRGGAYRGMVQPIVPFAIRGAIWYQGEANAIQGHGMRYADMQKALIADWRKAWGLGDFPFLYVQIVPCAAWYKGDNLPILWQAQRACLSVPNTGMVVTTDLVSDGIRNIHPRNKWDVGKRLALWALAKTYGRKDLVYSGPLYKGMAVEEGKVIISFDHVGGGLVCRGGGELTHFTIAGKDGNFVKADARIARSKDSKVDDIIVVSSPGAPAPTAVRFAWDQTAMPNLMNKEGLPASPFTTEPLEQLGRQGR
jgi:sialate O-acetylesterase